jgi:hypothetical protein
VVLEPQLAGEPSQLVAVALTLTPDHVGVGSARHDVEAVRMLLDDPGQRSHRDLDPLAG